MNNRYKYLGSSDTLFDVNGLSIQYGNPYDTIESLQDSLNVYCDEFLHEHFLNNVQFPSYSIILLESDKCFYDSEYGVWILVQDSKYHVFA